MPMEWQQKNGWESRLVDSTGRIVGRVERDHSSGEYVATKDEHLFIGRYISSETARAAVQARCAP